MLYKADLHIHSCLSPCAALDISPKAIVERALEIGLNCLALTDHNSTGNCAAMARLCEREGILFFPGMEAMTAEEAHIVCLFENVDAAEKFGKVIYENMPDIKYNPEKLGDQILVDENDDVEGFEERYLGVACNFTIDELRGVVRDHGGLFIAAHVDKPCFCVTSQLGFLSGEFDAVELSRGGVLRGGYERLTEGYAVVGASDSHYVHNIGGAWVEFESDCANIHGFKSALINRQTKTVAFDRAFRTEPKRRDV